MRSRQLPAGRHACRHACLQMYFCTDLLKRAPAGMQAGMLIDLCTDLIKSSPAGYQIRGGLKAELKIRKRPLTAQVNGLFLYKTF